MSDKFVPGHLRLNRIIIDHNTDVWRYRYTNGHKGYEAEREVTPSVFLRVSSDINARDALNKLNVAANQYHTIGIVGVLSVYLDDNKNTIIQVC